VNVTITSDKIVLSGSVPTGKDRQTAKRIAESYAGSRQVEDNLTVTGMGEQKQEENPPDAQQPPR
jgi:osmotically-inducible protein OsmY